MRIGRCAAAEEAEGFVRLDLVPGVTRDEDGIASGDLARFAVEFHQSAAFEDEVKFLGELVKMPLGGAAGGEAGFGQALQFNGGIRAVQDAPDGGAVFGGERLLGGKRVDCHGGCGIVRAPCVRRKHDRMEEASPTPEQQALEKRAGEARPIIENPLERGEARKVFSTFGCTAIITGASSGLGAEFARQLAGKADCLVLVARGEDKLRQVSEELPRLKGNLRVVTVPCDLATDEGRARFWERMDGLDLAPNLLINNAGHGDYGGFMEADQARIQSQIGVNITALTLMTHAFLKRVQATAERPAGILNVSSLAASTPAPDLAVYAATKSYVTTFSEALAMEMVGRHVHVLAVCPGPTPTNFSTTARRGDGKDTDRSGQGFLRMPPTKVVSIALDGLEAGRRRVFPGAGVALAAFLFEKMPRGLLRAILAARYRRAQRPK